MYQYSDQIMKHQTWKLTGKDAIGKEADNVARSSSTGNWAKWNWRCREGYAEHPLHSIRAKNITSLCGNWYMLTAMLSQLIYTF